MELTKRITELLHECAGANEIAVNADLLREVLAMLKQQEPVKPIEKVIFIWGCPETIKACGACGAPIHIHTKCCAQCGRKVLLDEFPVNLGSGA